MGRRQIGEKLRDVLATNQTLIDFVNANFDGATQKVFLGYNREDPPTSEEWPSIIIASIDAVEKRDTRARYRVTIGIYVGDSTETPGTNSVTFEGFLSSEDLAEKVEDTIFANQHEVGIAEIDANTMETPFFPMFSAVTQVTVEEIIESEGW